MRASRCLTIVALFAFIFLLTACSGLSSNVGEQVAATPIQLRLAPGDKLRVTVFGEDRLSGEYQIDNAGSLSLPLAGTIQGAGLTKSELEQSITTQLKSQYLRNP